MTAQGTRLRDKVAIVTGASRGLGQYCAVAYANEGAKVAIVARNSRETNLHMPGNVNFTAEMIEELTGEAALPIVCDLTDRAAVEAMVERVVARWGRVDVLVNNAAYSMADGESMAEVAPRLFEQLFEVNVVGAFNAIRAVLPVMRAQHSGHIINVSGRSRTRGSPLEATKAAIETLTIGLAAELRDEGIAVNSLRPVGFIDTPGVLLNPEVKPRDLTPPYSYIDAAILLAMQTAATYTGHNSTDAEVIRDLGDDEVLRRYRSVNPPAWRESLTAAAVLQS